MALLMLLFCSGGMLRAQVSGAGYFTLTNGHYYWFDGRENDLDDSKYLTGFDQKNSWAEIQLRGTHATESTTEIVAQGDTYLALDTTDAAHPTIKALSTDGGFDPLCVWYRTGKTGDYYQDWGGYRYYLYASHSEGLSVFRIPVNAPLTKGTTWYDWDHGMAIEEETWRDGAQKNSDYWLIYDTLKDDDGTRLGTPVWRMSTVHSYQRPEEMIYSNYRADGLGGNTWDGKGNGTDNGITYYDNVRVGPKNYPAGVAATFMPVTRVEHEKNIDGGSPLHGLQVSTEGDPVNLEGYTMTYGAAPLVISPVIDNTPVMSVIPAYTEYREETYRRGINLSSSMRTADEFGSAGVPTTRIWYYYPNDPNEPPTRHADHPGSKNERPSVESSVYTLDSRSTRYLSVTPGVGNVCTLSLFNRPMASFNAYLTYTVNYDNGVSVSITDTIHVNVTDVAAVVPHAQHAPVIKGSLFGGGKMANVTGNTAVTVHSADSIYAVYGGNDVAGWVQGSDGATLQIGTTQTNEDHPIHIGWVYGGGCGYYRYGQTYDATTPGWNDAGQKTTAVSYGEYCFKGGVYDWNDPTVEVVAPGTFDYDPYTGADFAIVEDGNRTVGTKLAGTVPYIKTAHINIGVPEVEGHSDSLGHNAHEHNDYILIDSLFGGAENAFIGVTSTGTPASAITLDIHGGTILAAFGGNNYGGSIANTAKTLVNVHCTKMTDDENLVQNSYYHGMGRDFGIRHLFGGGNKVDSPHSMVTFSGGMVDTAFVGGNSATVKNPIGIVNCRVNGTQYDYNGVAEGNVGYKPLSEDDPRVADASRGFQNGHFIFTNPYMTDTSFNGRGDQREGYMPDMGLYNVHYLFGGNNLAPMYNASFIQLLSGGVGSVYGGGNMGDMVNDADLSSAIAEHAAYIDIRQLVRTMIDVFTHSTLITPPNKIGAVIAASSGSKIIADYVYGGCRSANVKNSAGVYVAGGNYFNIIGGNDVSGDVGSEHDGATYVVVTGDAVVQSNVYGGCDGFYHCEAKDNLGKRTTGRYDETHLVYTAFNMNVDYDPYNDFVGMLIPTQQHSNVFVNGGLVKGSVVAGGVMADIGFSDKREQHLIKENGVERDLSVGELRGTVRLELADTAEVRGNVFGGGSNASIWGLSQVYVKGNTKILGSLFAGNDCIGSIQSHVPYQANLDDPTKQRSYFRYYYDTLEAETSATTHEDSVAYMAENMTSRQRLLAESAYRAIEASSNGDLLNYYVNTVDGIKQYNPKYSTYVRIDGTPIINSVYGSGNGAWDYDGTRPQFPETFICEGSEGDRPDQKSAYIDIHTEGGFIDTVFGGGNGCSVENDVVVLLNNTDLDNSHYPSTLPDGFKGGRSENFVGTIFGGNNFSPMNTVPEIRLVQGNVKNVYGGGNEGEMTKKDFRYDICGNTVENISTYILSQSDKVTVTDSVFGGCRMSDIEGMAYVDIRQTSNDGIMYLYGGNDMSGNVKGNTRVDISGGKVFRVWGGSNGRYDYAPVSYGLYNVYNFGTYDAEHPENGLLATAGKPNVDSTNVNLWGGTINASVFTGGSMADCRATCLVVDDQVGCEGTGNVTVNGALYGGGEGRWDDLNARDFEGKRWGNVNGSTHVHLHHAANVTSATAYGGGGGGDVYNTFIKTYDTWDNPFQAVYGGNWGADVFGTAHLEFNGVDLTRYLFGGNDFTGNVYKTEMVVNSGRFYNVYGGGNGDYPDSYYTSQHAAALEAGYLYQRADPLAYNDAKNKNIERPNTEYVYITFNDGEVDSCLYGGGRVGTVLPYQKDANREYVYHQVDTNNDGTNDLNRFIPDTTRAKAETVTDPEDFSHIVVNIHGGNFHRNVFAGGRGFKSNKKPLVYGLKVLNMDGGEVYESVYGGSEFVNDGYPAECKVPVDGSGNVIENPTRQQRLAVTTKRPSSIVNLTGGTVGSNLYGTGYQGIVHGSSYVNIGVDAIDSCTVWRNHYGGGTADSTYKKFKPGYKGGHSDALAAHTLTLKASVYSGANWGNASGEVTFNNPGFRGGESRMYVDGKDYNTINDPITSNPEMNLLRSLYGSGTSVLGGDIHSHIEVRNYGGMELCHPTKTIETIQRTDSLWLHNTAIIFKGTTDASQQYMSNRYSLKNIGYWNYRGYNVSELEAAADNVENLAFYEQGSRTTAHSGEKFDTVPVPVQDINVDINHDACGENIDICSKEYMVSATEPDKRHTLLILDNGVNLSIDKTENSTTTYGSVTGFGFVTTPGGYQSTITARPKMEITSPDNFNASDGGFVTTCDTSNRTRTRATRIGDINTAWTTGTDASTEADELKYTNYAQTNAQGYLSNVKKYREWKVGDKKGLRETEATLLAHSDPARLQSNNCKDWSMEITTGTGLSAVKNKYGIAEVSFEMPATHAGHYYMLVGEGFEMTGSNGEIDLVDSAWHPSLKAGGEQSRNRNMASALAYIGNHYSAGHRDPYDYGGWSHIPNGNVSEMQGAKDIHMNPEYTFGLIMVPNYNFATIDSADSYTYVMPSIDHDQNDQTPNQVVGSDWANFIINGNARVNSVNHYCSPKVYDNEDPSNPEVKPSMRLYLTYDTTFATTFNGTVTFQMMEYDENGKEVAPIQVKIYIQTIIDELKDIEQDVLAMYNGGRTNTFTRKVELVPCGEERNLYITGIRWMPTTNSGSDTTPAITSSAFGAGDRFSLLGDSSLVWATNDPSYPHAVSATHPGDNNHSSHNRFAMTLIPTNNVSEDAGMANGWIRGVGNRTNVYKLAYPEGTGATPVKTCQWHDDVDDSKDSVARVSLTSESSQGYFVGTLDGRGSAMLDVELTFDGTRTYDDMSGNGYVGKVILTMATFTEEDNTSRGSFDVTIYVKTRAHGDTIYIASADSVKRCVAPNKCLTVWPYSNVTHNGTNYQKGDIGKTPGMYVQTFRKALEEGIYEEGDVICVIDTVKITEPVHITGPNGPPIEVIRYDGHHHQLPDEQSIYRGPMIVVSNGTSFTAENIALHGGGGAHIKHIKRSGGADDYDGSHSADLVDGNLQFWTYTYGGKTIYTLPDTNIAYAPIIQAMGTATTVNLREGTVVQHNWNGYGHLRGQTDGNGLPTSSANMGAISITDGAKLTLSGNVKVENNFSHTMTGLDNVEPHSNIAVTQAPGGAAIYVDGGTVELPDANRNTAVTITDNYLMDPRIHTDPEHVSWWRTITFDGVPDRYAIDTATLKTWHRANVLLTREAPASGTPYELTMTDTQSDIFVISGTVGDSTKIGVRKWFPGIHERDTIKFATVTGGNNSILATSVTENKNFQSDDHFNVFYNSAVNLTTAYLFRCASFQHQFYVVSTHEYVDPVYDRYPQLTLKAGDVLHFGAKDNVCPAGGDSLIYRVQGGMMPYTYTWSDPGKTVTFQKTVTPYSNAQVQYDLAGGENGTSITGADRYAKYAASMTDTLLLPLEPVNPNERRKWNHLRVTATDATGACQLYKDIDLRILMDHSATDPVTFKDYNAGTVGTDTAYNAGAPNSGWATTPSNGWTDTSRAVRAIASRNFKGVQITPKVWVDRSSGTIAATVAGEGINDYVYQYVDESESHELTGLSFCPGDSLFLYTEPRGSSNKFIMWDFDPYYRPLARYIVPTQDATVTAYYGPEQYWYEHINSTAVAHAIYDANFTYSGRSAAGDASAGMVTTYNGDVHIYNENGLAWLISCVNGLNNTQARTYRFNRVFLHDKGSAYDMKDYLWTPLGSAQHPFMGRLFGVSSEETDEIPWSSIQQAEDGEGNPVFLDAPANTIPKMDTTWKDAVVIKNLIINEPRMGSTGLFGYLDSAGICNIAINGALVRGSQFVGAMAGTSKNSYVKHSAVKSDIEDSELTGGFGVGQIPTTILATHYVSGGMLGKSEHDYVSHSEVAAKFVGDAVYSGGGIGYGTASVIREVTGHNFNRLEGLYIGGIAGYLDGEAPVNRSLLSRLFGRKSSPVPSVVQNNYFHITGEGAMQRVGGVVGYAENAIIENNYIYGDLQGHDVGGVTAVAGNGTEANHNYYDAKSASQPTCSSEGSARMGQSSDFSGSGNQVTLSTPAYGINNLTRALNRWVRERNAQGGHFSTWRSDLTGVNNGYPVFGTPDLIPVNGVATVEGCGEVTFDGVNYSSDSVVTIHLIDREEMVDSTQLTYIVVHPLNHTAVSDSGVVGADYSGYGFSLSATETELLRGTLDSLGEASLVLTDTLSNSYGCDSVVTLTLTFHSSTPDPDIEHGSKVKVYPNPTTSWINVEADKMSHVEVYDNEGRRLQDYDADGKQKVKVDLSYYASGIYFIRIHTPESVIIHKVIKR